MFHTLKGTNDHLATKLLADINGQPQQEPPPRASTEQETTIK
jgi:hypothetical protein